jgi:hypothetical protein
LFTPAPVLCRLRGGATGFCLADLELLAVVATRLDPPRVPVDLGGVACESESKLKLRFLPSLDALRNDAGVMLGDASSSESSSSRSESDSGVLGRFDGARPLLPVGAALARREATDVRADLLTAFSAPGLTTFLCRLTVVVRVDLSVPWTVRLTTVGRKRFEIFIEVDRFMARSSRDAICLECSAASTSACSRAALEAACEFLTFAVAALPRWTLRFLGESALLSDRARPDPRKS